MIELVDSHAHLQEPEFANDLDAVIERARAAGVSSIIVPAVDTETTHSAIALAERYDGLYATAGFHPHEAGRLDEADLARIEALLEHPGVVAVGEIGLDFFRMHSSSEAQIEALNAQLGLAARHSLPVVLHCRDAWEEMRSILVPWAERTGRASSPIPLGVLHYFTGTLEDAWRYAELGFLLSIHTSVTHLRATAVREVAAALPLEVLLLETDSPYGAPQAFRGKRNEPAYLVEAARKLAELRGITVEEVAAATTANAKRLFTLEAAVTPDDTSWQASLKDGMRSGARA